jgi:hypothetical protein
MVLWSQTWLLRAETKTMHPYECGNPKCKAIASGWLSDERLPHHHRHQSAASLAAQDSGRAKALGIRHQCRTAPTRMRRARRRSIVKAAALYTNWLAPSFNIDSRSRQVQFYQSPNSERAKLPSLGCRKWTIANFNSQQFLWHSCKNHKIHKLLIFTPL